jgi:hypothetical protein
MKMLFLQNPALRCLCLEGIVPETVTLLSNLQRLTVQYNEFQVDPHWLLEYIPEDCEFEADEDPLFEFPCWARPQYINEDDE